MLPPSIPELDSEPAPPPIHPPSGCPPGILPPKILLNLSFKNPDIVYINIIYKKYIILIKKNIIKIDFKDNGMGIDLNKYGEKLFGMYKTFHQHEDSRGLGLFIIRNQIESMGGYIDVESELNIGTTFKIYLPYEKN